MPPRVTCKLRIALEDPGARDHEQMEDWIGDHFDPEVFSPREVDMVVGQLKW